MPSFEYTGTDPLDHFWLGRVSPGDVVELDEDPAGPWKPSKRKPKQTEHGSDAPSDTQEV